MKIYSKIYVIFSCTLLILTTFPTINSLNINNIQTNNIEEINYLDKINIIIIHSKLDGNINITIKDVIYGEYKNILLNITKTISQTKNNDISFLNIFNILKDKNLINNETSIEDIIGDKISLLNNITKWNLSIMEPFVSMFVPLIAMVGMGFGAGIGDKVGSLTGLLYQGGIIGLGGILCIDPLMKTIYVQYTFTFPLLFHLLTSFIGIIMFPVHFDFIYDNYLPIFIYSNFIAIGTSSIAIGIPLGI